MIPAIVSLVVMTIVAVSLWQIVTGLFEIVAGLFLIVSGTILYCLSFPVDYIGRAIRFLLR